MDQEQTAPELVEELLKHFIGQNMIDTLRVKVSFIL